MAFPATRLRRLRRTAALRGMVCETRLDAADLIQPLFVRGGSGPAVILFGLPDHKDEAASSAYDEEGIVQMALRALRMAVPDLVLITDVCLCQYTSHGHCG